MLGDVIRVDNRDGSDCEGHFILIHVQFDVTLPLIRQAPVTFPEVGEKMVEFRYEYLPNYCFACGRLGHSTQVCLKKYANQCIQHVSITCSPSDDIYMPLLTMHSTNMLLFAFSLPPNISSMYFQFPPRYKQRDKVGIIS